MDQTIQLVAALGAWVGGLGSLAAYELNKLNPDYKVRLGDCFLLPAK
ncbi:MAG: hypothetical protein OXD45_02900 [Rhodobacteraceae bacterium]|nr:hypothetical protein [Paracoccaceae bacterium]MCY4308942.1 hypothetical protein [Paracoccaceae bacterium]